MSTNIKDDRCENCGYFSPLTAAIGECRKKAPRLVRREGDMKMCAYIGEPPPSEALLTAWPTVNMFKWCGDFIHKSARGKEGRDTKKSDLVVTRFPGYLDMRLFLLGPGQIELRHALRDGGFDDADKVVLITKEHYEELIKKQGE